MSWSLWSKIIIKSDTIILKFAYLQVNSIKLMSFFYYFIIIQKTRKSAYIDK